MLQFSKYQGLGNDFLILEGRANQLAANIVDPDPAWIRACVIDASASVEMA